MITKAVGQTTVIWPDPPVQSMPHRVTLKFPDDVMFVISVDNDMVGPFVAWEECLMYSVHARPEIFTERIAQMCLKGGH